MPEQTEDVPFKNEGELPNLLSVAVHEPLKQSQRLCRLTLLSSVITQAQATMLLGRWHRHTLYSDGLLKRAC